MSFLSSLLNSYTNNNEDCDIIIKDSLGGSVTIPVLPSSFNVTVKQNNTTVNINNLGELNIIGKTGLKTISFTSFFPAQAYSFAKGDTEPYAYIDKINNMRISGKPCRIIISNTNINIPVTIDSFSYQEKDGSCDVYYSIELKEYRFIGAEKDTTNGLTGLKSRESWLQTTAKNITVYPSDSIGDVLGRAIGKTEAGNKNSYLKYYKNIGKSGGVKPGQTIDISKILMH